MTLSEWFLRLKKNFFMVFSYVNKEGKTRVPRCNRYLSGRRQETIGPEKKQNQFFTWNEVTKLKYLILLAVLLCCVPLETFSRTRCWTTSFCHTTIHLAPVFFSTTTLYRRLNKILFIFFFCLLIRLFRVSWSHYSKQFSPYYPSPLPLTW